MTTSSRKLLTSDRPSRPQPTKPNKPVIPDSPTRKPGQRILHD